MWVEFLSDAHISRLYQKSRNEQWMTLEGLGPPHSSARMCVGIKLTMVNGYQSEDQSGCFTEEFL